MDACRDCRAYALLSAALGHSWRVGVSKQQSHGDASTCLVCEQANKLDVLGEEHRRVYQDADLPLSAGEQSGPPPVPSTTTTTGRTAASTDAHQPPPGRPDPAPSPPAKASRSANFRVRKDRVDRNGKLTLRHASRLHHIGIGHHWAGTHVLMLIRDRNIRIITQDTAELIRELVLDPTRDYQPQPRTATMT